MSLREWVRNGWFTTHRSSAEETKNLLGLADRDLQACQLKGLHSDWRFAIAYNAALQAATAALAAAGFRTSQESHHYRVIHSLELTIRADSKLVQKFDAFRKKRNAMSYDLGGAISDKETAEMAELARALRSEVARWIRAEHPELL